MDKRVIWAHRILFSAGVIMLSASLVYYLIRWGSLPEEIGVHFDGKGQYNVVDAKFYGFYPHLIGGIITAGIAVAGHFVKSRSTGLGLDEKGEELFRSELILTLDIFLLYWSGLFSLWSYSVAMQIPLDNGIVGSISQILGILMLIGIVLQIVTCIRHRVEKEKKEKAENALGHRLCRLIAWLLAAGGLLILAECYGRLPSDPQLYLDPDYRGLAYFANFGAYYDKRLLLIPHGIIIFLLAVLEVIQARVKNDRKDIVLLMDRLKVICSVFFIWWNMLLDIEEGIGVISVGLFLILCTVSFVLFAAGRKKQGEH